MSNVLYDQIGIGYSRHRQPEPRIAARISGALGVSGSVLNVGAGTGSYEPPDRFVVAVEPSAEMLHQRPPGAAPAIQACANRLPFPDHSFQAVLAILTIHHWRDWKRGLREMRRTAQDRVVIMTWDPNHEGFWLVQDYFPEILAIDQLIFPTLDAIEQTLGPIEICNIPIPANCCDGFLGAYWRRPAAYLDSAVRGSISTFAKLGDPEPSLRRLEADLADGGWEGRHAELLTLSELDIGYRLIVHRTGA